MLIILILELAKLKKAIDFPDKFLCDPETEKIKHEKD